MTLHGQREIVLVHTATIVDDADQLAAAGFNGDVDARCAGVERVLHQLLHRSGGPLDDFTSRNAIDENGIETTNSHQGRTDHHASSVGLNIGAE